MRKSQSVMEGKIPAGTASPVTGHEGVRRIINPVSVSVARWSLEMIGRLAHWALTRNRQRLAAM